MDLIDRQHTIDALRNHFTDGFEEDRWWNSTHVLAVLKDEPSAQKKGKWLTPKEYCQHLYETTGERYSPAPTGLEIFVYCSQCGKTSWFSNKYCPHCGSRNRGEENEID